MEPVDYTRLIRRRWRVVAACCLVSAVAVWVVTPAKPSEQLPEFVAEHTLVRDSEAGGSQQALASVSLFMKTGVVPARVAERVGFTRPPGLLARSIVIEVDEQVGSLTVQATAKGRAAAADLANAFAEETLSFLGERAQQAKQQSDEALTAKLSQHQAAIAELSSQIAAAEARGESPVLVEAQRAARLTAYGADLVQQQQQAGQPAPTAGYVSLETASPDLATLKGAGFGVPTSRPVRTAGAAAFGLVLGVLLVLVVERVDPRIHVRAGAERAFRLPVVAEVPFAQVRRPFEVLTVTDPSSSVAEAYRALRASLLLIPSSVLTEPAQGARNRRGRAPSLAEAPPPKVVSILGATAAVDKGSGNGHSAGAGHEQPQVLLVTSAAPSEGKTATVANLAASFAEAGRSVLVLSCDFRRPSIHQYLGVDQARGLTEVLNAGPDAPTLAQVVKDTPIPGVRIATNGSPLDNFGEVTAAGRKMVADARRLADIVLIDTAPLLVAHEATELIPAADSVVVLCRSGHTTKEDASRARDLLTRLGASVAGVVLVGAPEAETSFSTYYYAPPAGQRRRGTGWLTRRSPSRQPAPQGASDAHGSSKKRAVI